MDPSGYFLEWLVWFIVAALVISIGASFASFIAAETGHPRAAQRFAKVARVSAQVATYAYWALIIATTAGAGGSGGGSPGLLAFAGASEEGGDDGGAGSALSGPIKVAAALADAATKHANRTADREQAKANLQQFGLSPKVAESFLKTTPKVVAPALGAIFKSLDAAKYQDLWANARYNRFGPGVRTAWSGVQGVSLFLGGLNLVEPYSRVGISLTVNQAQAISAIRGIRLTAVTYAAGKGAFAGFTLGGGPAGIPLSLVTASAGAVVAGAGADFVFGRIEDWVFDWAGYPSQ